MIGMGVRRCRDCGIIKTVDDMLSNRRYPCGYDRLCKDCQCVRSAASRAKHDPEALRAYWRRKYKEKGRAHHLMKTYGLTLQAYDDLVEAQGGECPICGDEPHHVDHCHETGEIRAVLCTRCNPGLGWFRDSPEILRAAADYLEAH